MFGNNPFAVLDAEPSNAGPITRVVEGEEVDADWFKLVKVNHDVNVRVSDRVTLQGLPHECNLMAISNIHRLVIVASDTVKEFVPVSTPTQILPLSGRPVWIRLAMAEERLVVALEKGAGVCLYKLADVVSGNVSLENRLDAHVQTSPYHVFTANLPTHLLDVLPNPATPSSSDLLAKYVLLLASEGFVIADIDGHQLSSPVSGPFTSACWSAKGKQLVVGTPSGEVVQYTPEGVIKAQVPSPPDHEPCFPTSVQWLENDLFLVSYATQNASPDDSLDIYVIHRQKSSFTFTKFYDPIDSMGVAGRSGAYRHYAGLKSWGNATKHLAFMISGLASEVGVLHGKPTGDKEQPQWEVLVLDETARGVMPAGKPGVTDDTSCLGLDLDLTSQRVIKRGIEGGVELDDLPPAPRLMAYSQEGILIAFDVIYPDAGAYPLMINGSPVSATQQPPQTTTTPVGTPAKSAAFGSSMGPSAFGASTTPAKPAFGGSAFGSTTPSSSPAFGSSSKPAAFGASAFGTPTTTPGSKPAAFGQSSIPTFGQASTPAFGSSTPAAFGQSAFGQPAKPASTTPSAFASASAPSTGLGFGAFGGAKAGAVPNFGFGSGQPSTASDQTKPSPFGSGGFGSSAFGSKASPSGSTPSAFAGFGQKSETAKPAFSGFGGSSQSPAPTASAFAGFGGKSSSEKSAFSGFGSPATSTAGSSAIGGFDQKPTTKTAVSTPFVAPATPTSAGFGMDSFSDALTSSSKSGVVPGLEESPPTSPVLAPRRPGGLNDSPPNSPPPEKPRPPPTATPSASASFIRPATAFGSPGSFGAFGQASSKSAAFGASSTPAAFSSPSTPADPKPAFGGTAFGQSSTPSAFGQNSTPVAFGTSSKPSAFGTPSIPATAGFGAFTAKPSTPVTGGFGGFAAKSSSPGGVGFAGFGSSAARADGDVNAFSNLLSSGNTESASKPVTKSAFSTEKSDPIKQEPIAVTKSLATRAAEEVAPQSLSAPTPKSEEIETSGTPPKSPKDGEGVTEVRPKHAEKKPADAVSTTPSSGAAPAVQSTTPPTPVKYLPSLAGSPIERRESPEAETTVVEVNSARIEVISDPDDASEGEDAESHDEEGSHDNNHEEEHAEQSYEEVDDDEEEYDEEYDEEDLGETGAEEGDDEEEDDDQYRLRSRRSFSEPPDLDTVEEESEHTASSSEPEQQEGSEGLKDKDQSPSKKMPKSPEQQPWFVKKSPSPTPLQPPPKSSASGESLSLFSRLSPAPPSDPTTRAASPVFSLKHAAKTSSPLSTAPVQLPSTTPPGTPGRPATTTTERVASEEKAKTQSDNGSAGFSFAKTEVKKEISPEPPTPSLSVADQSGQSKPSPSDEAPKQTSKPQFFSTTPSTTTKPFSFGPPASLEEQAKPSSISFGPPKAPTEPSKSPSFFGGPPQGGNKASPFGLGLGKPPAPAPARSPVPDMTAPPPLFSFPSASAPTASSTPPLANSDTTFHLPSRSAKLDARSKAGPDGNSMGAVIERAIAELLEDLRNLKSTLASNRGYHRALNPASFPRTSVDNLENHKILPFSALNDMREIVTQLTDELASLRSQDALSEIKLAELQSRMLKCGYPIFPDAKADFPAADMKVGQADKFLKARQDPSFARVMQIKDLSPSQAASQVKLRKMAQMTETRLEELDAGIIGLKRKIDRKENSKSSSSLPFERIQRSVRNVDAAIRDRLQAVDDLTKRINSITVSTPWRSRAVSEQPIDTPTRSNPKVKPDGPVPFRPTSEEIQDVEAVLDREAKMKSKRLVSRKVSRTPVPSRLYLNHSAVKNGPVMIDVLPLPGQTPRIPSQTSAPRKPAPVPVVSTPAPAPTAKAPATSPFASIVIGNLDPGVVTSSGPRVPRTSARAHTPAAKFTGTGLSPTPATPSSLFDFPPPAASPTPSNFFSFAGFGKK
ncbi:hypothetical protein P7C73_g4252, partial [Tremellales sp. Uapishka_1]